MFGMIEMKVPIGKKIKIFKKSNMATKSKMAAITKWWPYWILVADTDITYYDKD